MKKLFLSFLTTIIGLCLIAPTPVFAAAECPEGCVPTSILGEDYGGIKCKCDNGDGSSIKDILNLVIDIMTIGIGILGVIGISVVGIQYLTAGGNEEQTRKAKRRMFEIIIGLAVYAVFYAVLTFFGINTF